MLTSGQSFVRRRETPILGGSNVRELALLSSPEIGALATVLCRCNILTFTAWMMKATVYNAVRLQNTTN
jgi:hypothetical protein